MTKPLKRRTLGDFVTVVCVIADAKQLLSGTLPESVTRQLEEDFARRRAAHWRDPITDEDC